MTMEALKAKSEPRRDNTDGPAPIKSNVSTIYLGDAVHVIQPVKYEEEAGIFDESSKCPEPGGSVV